jgi:hypothetical protein
MKQALSVTIVFGLWVSAVRAFGACLKAFVLAMGASDSGSLRTGKQVDDKPDQTGEKYQSHPENGTIHTSCFSVSCNPNQEGDVKCSDNYESDD